MDCSNWKRILLHWANRSGFFERTYYNLEQTDAEEFFQRYYEHISDKLNEQIELKAFLKEQYPEFDLHLDDDNHLSSSEYMYIYSILLHYCCVKQPVEYFHRICQNLHEQFQITIASFFKAILNKELTKANIRHAIAEASPRAPLHFPPLESPARTPKCTKESPPTPKTTLLEERKKELNLLKALLDTERYEKGFLEVQIKQYEDKINKLSREHKTLITEIQELKRELLAKNTDNSSPVKNTEDEHIKKRLRKDISEKEEEILRLSSKIDELEEEKDLVNEKLSYAQEQVKTCLEKIKDMDNIINDLKTEIEKKDETIGVLTETKIELEQFINETRLYNGYRSNNDLNTSAECLDISITRTTSSSGSISSPENLGRSVVDIQLREKENENRLLREQMEKMNLDNFKLVKHIRELMIKYSNVFEICSENLIANEEGDVTETFIVFENYVEKLKTNYLNLCNTAKSLNDEMCTITAQNKVINEKVRDLENALNDSAKRIEEILGEKNTLIEQEKNLKATYNECLVNLDEEIHQKNIIAQSVEKITKAFDELKCEKDIEKEEFLCVTEEKEKLIEERSLLIESLEIEIAEYRQKILNIETINEDFKKEKSKMSEEIQQLKSGMNDSKKVIKQLIESNNELTEYLRSTENNSKIMAEEIEKLVNEGQIKENTIKLLASELNASDMRNIELNNKIEHLEAIENDLANELQETNVKIKSLKESISKFKIENEKLESEYQKYQISKEELIQKLERENSEFKIEIEKYQELNDEANSNVDKSIEKIQSLESVLDELKQHNEQLSHKISEQSAEYKNLEMQVKTIENDKSILQQEMHRKKDELLQKIELVEQNNKTFDREIELLLTKMESGRGNDDGDAQIVCDLSSSVLEKLKDNLNLLLNENAVLMKEVSKLEDNIASLVSEIDELRPLKNKINEKNQQLEKLNEEFNSKFESLEAEKTTLNRKITELMETITNLEGSNSKLIELNSQLEKSSIELNNELKQKNEDNLKLSDEVNSLKTEIDGLTKKLKESQVEIERTVGELRKIESQKNEIIKNLEGQIITYQKHEYESEKISKEHCSLIEKLQAEQKEWFKRLNDEEKSLENKEKQILEFKTMEKSLQEEVEKLSKLYDKSKHKENDLQEKLASAEKEIENLSKELNDLNEEKIRIHNELKESRASLAEANKYIQELKDEHEKELNSHKQKINETEQKTHKIIEELQKEKASIQIELEDTKDKMNSLDKKSSHLVEQIASLKHEKEELHQKNNLLKEDLSSIIDEHEEYRTKLVHYKNGMNALSNKIIELEDTVKLAEFDMSEERKRYEDLRIEFESFKKENSEEKEKCDEIHDSLNKRLERISIQLGESKARIKHLEKENAKLEKSSEINQSLKEKYSDIQMAHDELILKNQNLKSEYEILQEQYQKLNSNLQEQLENLRKRNIELEEQFKTLSQNYEKTVDELKDIKTENEILNESNATLINDHSKLIEIFKVDKDNLIVTCQSTADNLYRIEDENEYLRNSIEKLCIKLNEAQEENTRFSNTVSKLSLRLEILQKENDTLKNEVLALKTNVSDLQYEKQNLETENLNSLANLKELQVREVEMMDDRVQLEKDLKEQIEDLEKLLIEKDMKIQEIEEQLKNIKVMNSHKLNQEIETKIKIINELKLKVEEIEKYLVQEKDFNEKLQNDVEILRAKLIKNRQLMDEKDKEWTSEREKLIEAAESAENRIKDNRLELEGKLEKMKMKMKALYNDEMSKIKNKHEREIKHLKYEFEALKAQNQKYETHTQILSKQIFKLNETNLDLQKKNKFMETRLKDLESMAPSSNLRRQQHHMASAQGISQNLQMEDEEGELFNNTYLADLKSGRMSPFGRDSITVEELKYRNSLALPHLKSTYLAQYVDHDLPEEDIKDGIPINFDDSLSSLLQTGQRKKLTGTTSYKKPGPPTPSKNAGRLSFGGSCAGDNPSHPREILKEVHDTVVTNTKKSTPSKFRLFSGTKSRDESLSGPKRILRERRKSINIANGAFTSTPRKSKAHYDQRRQLDLFLNSTCRHSTDSGSNQTGELDYNCDDVFKVEMQAEKDFEQTPDAFVKWRQPNIQSTTTTESCTTSDSNSPCPVKNDRKQNIENEIPIPKLGRKTTRDRRISIYSRGNIISSSKLPSNMIRNQMRNRAKYQRCATFNKYRKSLCEVTIRKPLLDLKKSSSPTAEELKMQNSSKDSVDKQVIVQAAGVDFLDSNDTRNYRFEQLLKDKESSAPFEVAEINLVSTMSSNATASQCTNTNTTAASSKTTVYAGSIIINRKIPHVNTTMARKMSLFLGSTNGRGIILLAGQTISIMDLIVLWNRMSLLTKFVLIIFVFAFILHI